MIARRVLFAVALVAGALAAVLYYSGAQRTPVVVAARDLDATAALGPDDLAIVSLSADAVPLGTVSEIAEAIGKVPRAPLWRGQVLLRPALSDSPAAFHSGLVLPTGTHAVALPVTAGQAVGGAVGPGARIDVIAVPVAGRAPAGRVVELLVANAMVLDVRGESGAAYSASVPKSGLSAAAVDRIGSVVIALDPLEEVRVADRIATSTFVITLIAPR
ncbi:MAG TPA: RcpC/CpaB family pilus assembly protein [Candidatus Limnocylindria bacterium]